MQRNLFLPEGSLIHTKRNTETVSSFQNLSSAMENEEIIEGMAVLCDDKHNLIVDAGGKRGIIPYKEAALGIEEGSTREIAVISKVGKPVSCIVRGIDEHSEIPLLLSRVGAQRKALAFFMETLIPGDIIPARVTHLEPFGAFVDIGCGITSLIGIENLSVSRISHPRDRVSVGDCVLAVILGKDEEKGRVALSHRELLGTWQENADRFKPGQTVCGVVRGVEDYGIFIELLPNLSGLAEYREDINVGSRVSVYIKSIVPEKMKIKLIIIDSVEAEASAEKQKIEYFTKTNHISEWRYSPRECTKKEIVTVFDK